MKCATSDYSGGARLAGSAKNLFFRFSRFFGERLDGFGQRIFLVGRMEVEINPAQRPGFVALAQNDCHLFVQRDAVAQSFAAIFVGRWLAISEVSDTSNSSGVLSMHTIYCRKP